jgi:gamma-glutamyl-gamma-aminobutyrate hydrolase PuuD
MIIILGDRGLVKLFNEYDDNVIVSYGALPNVYESLGKPKAVIFGGGTDVNPLYYGQSALRSTDAPDKARDANEALWFSYCRTNKIPMIGICRGAQFGCVLSGGELYQHVSGHALGSTHSMETADGEVFEVTSTHHQMMAPKFTNHSLLGWSFNNLSQVYKYDEARSSIGTPEKEPEVVYFHDTNFLAFQYHPEYMSNKDTAVHYFHEQIEKHFPNILEE